MSTKFDVLDAKQAYYDHIAIHKCRLGHDTCPERVALWRAYCGSQFSAAHKWGLEYGDETWQWEQSAKRVGGLL